MVQEVVERWREGGKRVLTGGSVCGHLLAEKAARERIQTLQLCILNRVHRGCLVAVGVMKRFIH